MSTQMDLLKKLGSGVVPTGESSPARLGRAQIGSAGFSDLLKAATGGKIESGRAVEVEKESDLELSEEQLSRLGAAADKAELAGASKVLVEIDGQWLKLDVGTRKIARASEMKAGEVVTGIDAVVPEDKANGTIEPTGTDWLAVLGKKVGGR